MTSALQFTFNFKKHIWSCPSEYKDLSAYDEIAIDLETETKELTINLVQVGLQVMVMLLVLL